MRFTASGTVYGEEVTVTWTDGALTGNGAIIRQVLLEAANLEGELVGPVGQQTDTQHLKSALSALLVIDRVMPDAKYSGEVPEAAGVPDGAVI